MDQYPDKYFDLAIVDPPYGINAPNMQMGSAPNRKGNGQYPGESTAIKIKKGRLNGGSGKLKDRALNTMDCDCDYEKPTTEYFKELFRISKDQIIWGGNYFDLPPTIKTFLINSNMSNRTISSVSLKVAIAIGGYDIKKFHEQAKPDQYTIFTHQNFFYSYPEFGKHWPDNKPCEFHRVNVKCHFCDFTPDRNYAGYGSIYVLHNKVNQGNRMIFLCKDHVKNYELFDPIRPKKKLQAVQLQLF